MTFAENKEKKEEAKKENRHNRKTRTAIQNALLSIMSEKSIEKITISELASRADVNRKTFYNHYSCLQDVLQELDEMYLDMLFPIYENIEKENLVRDPYSYLDKIITEFTTYPERTKLLFDSGVSNGLTQRLKDGLSPYLNQLASNIKISPLYMTYVIDYIVFGIASILDEWVHSEGELSQSEMNSIMYTLIESSVHGFSKNLTSRSL